MQITTTGLVLREVKTGESDRILTILTPAHGIISAAAKGSLRPKNKLFSATGLFGYSDFALFEGRTMYRVNEASSIEVFFGLRQDVESLALATYMAELAQILSPTGEEAEKLLQLTLNSFYVLAQHKQPAAFVKAVYELRSFSEAGFMPNLLACEDCGKYEDDRFYFDLRQGSLLCAACAGQRRLAPNLDAAALAALRHIVLADARKVFSFTLKGNSLTLLKQIAEEYVLCNLDYPPKSLGFYKSLQLGGL
ncbi:DNA repair protein RecO [Ruminococcaceae bacterium OttesenSCG-928-A16]|nr:DNA repair protein RecO [Ruminococcaceae bacterium OttesenSCG-928-A16]